MCGSVPDPESDLPPAPGTPRDAWPGHEHFSLESWPGAARDVRGRCPCRAPRRSPGAADYEPGGTRRSRIGELASAALPEAARRISGPRADTVSICAGCVDRWRWMPYDAASVSVSFLCSLDGPRA